MTTNELDREIILNDEKISNIYKRLGRLRRVTTPLEVKLCDVRNENDKLKREQFIRDNGITMCKASKAPKSIKTKLPSQKRELDTMQSLANKIGKLDKETLNELMARLARK